ncbi:MAG: hypothetical protein ACI8SJ_002535 [Shewanella sp.]|jgi:hypothetical protein
MTKASVGQALNGSDALTFADIRRLRIKGELQLNEIDLNFS